MLHAQSDQIQWYTYSENYQTYIPVKKPGKKVSFFLDLKEKNSSLVVETSVESALFLENKLLSKIKPGKSFTANLDSLSNLYQLDSAFVTIYSFKSLAGLKTYFINSEETHEEELDIYEKVASGDKDFYIFGFVLVLLIAAIVRINATAQSIYLLSMRQIFLSQIVDNPFYSNSFFSRESIRFYVVLSSTLALTGIYFSEAIGQSFPLPSRPSFLLYFLYWFFYTMIVYLFFYTKFLLYKFLSGIYNFRRYTLIQNYDFMRVSIIVSVIYFLILFVDLFLININLILLAVIPLLTILIYIFTTYKKLNKVYSHTKLHLFSYLCVSEIVPWIFLAGILGN